MVLGFRTIYPRVANDYRALWKLKLSNFSLYPLIFQRYFLDQENLLSISWTMYIRTESEMAVNPSLREIDYRLVKFVLSVVNSDLLRIPSAISSLNNLLCCEYNS